MRHRTSPRFPVCAVLLALGTVSPWAAEGQTHTAMHLHGSIDRRLAIEVTLDRAGSELDGFYFYSRIGRAIRVSGTLDKAGHFRLQEVALDHSVTGLFQGTLVGTHLKGTWRKVGSKRGLPVMLTLDADATPKQPLPGSAVLKEKRLNIRRSPELTELAARSVIHVRYPIVVGGTGKAARQRLNQVLRSETVYSDTSIGKLAEDGWLDEIDYLVNYNRHSLLDVTRFVSGVGAYPDTLVDHVVLNLKTGARVRATDLFKSNKLQALAALVNENFQVEMREARKAEKDQSDELEKLASAGVRFTIEDLDHFYVSDNGLTFDVEYEFPHAIKALEPPGLFFYPYEALKPYLRQDGLLAPIVAGSALHR